MNADDTRRFAIAACSDKLARNREPNTHAMTCRTASPTSFENDNRLAFDAPSSPDALLKSVPATLREQPVYAYIVTTIKTKPGLQLRQEGSAPNFEGGRITLCTCKHKDRATFRPLKEQDDPWKNVWVAGLTSKSEDPSRSLAYLMCVERSFLSQMELWRSLPSSCRRAKSASQSELGDLFEPKAAAAKDPNNPAHYYSPIGGHVHSPQKHPDTWHHDIMQWRSKPHRLLLGQSAHSYRWVQVKLKLKSNSIGVSAHHKMYNSLIDFIGKLEEFNP